MRAAAAASRWPRRQSNRATVGCRSSAAARRAASFSNPSSCGGRIHRLRGSKGGTSAHPVPITPQHGGAPEPKSLVSRVLSPCRSAGGDHLSGSHVAVALERPTRESSEAGHLIPSYLVLLRVGFTEPPPSPEMLVSSYLTVSPLPRHPKAPRRFVFCGTGRGIASPGRYPAPCPAELGLSSNRLRGSRSPERLQIPETPSP